MTQCLYFHIFFSAVEMNESSMGAVFRYIDDVNWPLIGQKLHLSPWQFNDKCLRQTLKQWHNKKKGDPWTTWRMLAVVAECLCGSKAGQELRKQAGVGA